MTLEKCLKQVTTLFLLFAKLIQAILTGTVKVFYRNEYFFVVFFSIYFFNSVLRPFQSYFRSYETGQSVGVAKTGKPREKTPDTPASRTWLISHVARGGSNPHQTQRRNDRVIKETAHLTARPRGAPLSNSLGYACHFFFLLLIAIEHY